MVNIGGFPNPWRAGRNSSGSRLEIINRSGNGEDVLKRALSKVKPEYSGEAHFRFGKASRFTLTTPEQRTNPGVSISWPPDDPPDDPKDGIVIIDLNYIDRAVEVIRIEQDGEPENWIETERITVLMTQHSVTGVYYRIHVDWSKKPSESKRV